MKQYRVLKPKTDFFEFNKIVKFLARLVKE